MERSETKSLEQARALHRMNRLEDALAAYTALLAATPDDPDLIGLLGVVALQQGRLDDAEDYLRRSLALGGGAAVDLRNLNNLVVLLREAGREDAARTLLAEAEPEWREDGPAVQTDRDSVLSLIEALIGYGQPQKARALLDQAIAERDEDAAALNLDGRLRLEEGDLPGAIEILERAAGLAPDDCQPLIALAHAQNKLGQTQAARATGRKIARMRPVYGSEPRPSQDATILVLNTSPKEIENPNTGLRGLHFSANYGSQVASALQDEFRFLSLFGDLPASDLPATLPQVDIVLNNIVNSEPMNVPGRLDTVRANAERPGRPVINHPLQVFQTTRQKTALLLDGVPNLRVPQIARYRRDLSSIDDIVADIDGQFEYPVILREVGAHMSAYGLLPGHRQSAALLADAAAVRALLEVRQWPEFYAVQFIDLKKPGGYYRKIRAMFLDEEIVVASGGYLDQWMVSGWRYRPIGINFYRAHPECIEDLRRIVADPAGVFGEGFTETLAAIRDRIPLDMFGIDFDVDAEGRVVLFEASAAMAFLELHRPEPDLALDSEVYERINAAFRRMVLTRLDRD